MGYASFHLLFGGFFRRFVAGVFLIFCLSFFFSESFAGVWIASPDTPPLEFKAHVMALGKGKKTYAQNRWEYLKKQTKGFRLKNRITKAQAAYLSGDSSKKLFQSIADMAYVGDWNEEQRRVILYALLRLAQLSDSPNEKKAFLIFASRFITEDLSSTWPEYNLFPPPLVERLNQLKSGQTSFLIDWRKRFPHHEIVLVNGKKMKGKTRLNEGRYRITALSSTHAPYVRTLHLSELLSGVLKTQPLTEGHCDTLKVRPQWHQRHIKLFRRKDCRKEYAFQGQSSHFKNPPSFHHNREDFLSKKRELVFSESKNVGNLRPSEEHFMEETRTGKKDFKNSRIQWIVIGAAVVALSFVIVFGAADKKASSPERRVFH